MAKPERFNLSSRGIGIEKQVSARDAHIQSTRAHVGRDVPGPEIEELGVIAGIWNRQCAQVSTSGIACLDEHLDGSLGQSSLIGDGNS